MMSPGKPEQGAPQGGAERQQEQRAEAGASDKSRQQSAGAQGGYGPQGPQGGGYGPWWGGPGGFGMPPGWGMPPGMSGQPGYGFGGPHGMHHHHRPWDPYQPQFPPWPMAWMSWFVPWLGPWWSWVSSWFVWPGLSWMMPPFAPFMPPPPFPPGTQDGVPGSTLRFAETRASFWRHWFEAIAEIWRQAANASYVPGAGPAWCPPPQVDLAQLKEALKGFPEAQAAFVIHAVCAAQAWDGMRQQGRTGPDW